MAEQLVEAMTERWSPEQYRDEYHDELMKLIQEKAKSGEIKGVEEAPPAAEGAEIIDIAELLKRSMQKAKQKKVARNQNNISSRNRVRGEE